MSPSPVSAASPRGRHRAVRQPTAGRRAALALVAAAAPVLPAAALAAPAHADTDWDELAQCESTGDWSINTGNGFSGGLQFTPSTWKAFGGTGKAHEASREEQIRVAERVKAEQGMNAWPTCSKKTGNTSNAPNSSVPSGSSGSSEKSSTKKASTETPKKKAPAKKAVPSGGSYTVKDGDTLGSIASAYGTSWRSLQSGNADVLTDPNMIFPGQVIDL